MKIFVDENEDLNKIRRIQMGLGEPELMTPRGYTIIIMEWDTFCQNWAGAEFCATPERMRDLLLDDFACYLEYKITLCSRPLEDSERQMIQQQVTKMADSLQ